MKKNRFIEVVVKVIALWPKGTERLRRFDCTHSFPDGTGHHQLHGTRTVLIEREGLLLKPLSFSMMRMLNSQPQYCWL